jgi:hypothetical protein
MFQYWGFGLTITSEIEFPELFPFSFEHADLVIRQGITPEQLTGDDVLQKVRTSISPKEYLLKVLNVANYYAAHGNEIIVEAMPGADEKSVRLFLLSNAIAAILHQRDLIPFHASAVHYQDGLLLFCGRSGAGKSTLASALQLKGYKIFSDDVCVLKHDAGTNILSAYTSYPMMKLWEDSFAKIGLDAAAEEDKIRPELAKYARFYHDDFDINAYPVKQVFVLDPDGQDETTTIEKLGPIKGFTQLQKNTYRFLQMNAMKKRGIHFSIISKLAAAVPVYKINRPKHGNTIEDVIKLVESHLPAHV